MDDTSNDRRLPQLAWAVLWLTTAVILGGSIVRATGSGDGCGDTWPRCAESIFPLSGSTETAIEFSHRLTSALLGVAIATLIVMALRRTQRGEPVRKALWWSAAFFMGEVIIGAMLVLFGWVDDDASLGRLIVVPLHLVNTLFLLGSLTLTAHFARGGTAPRFGDDRQRDRLVLAGVGILLVVAASGALNALADTLYPAETFAEGLRAEFGSSAPFLVRLRVLHPIIAISGGLAMLYIVRHPVFDPLGRAARYVRLIIGIVIGQFLVGITNVAMATPVEIQVVHLLVADVLWITYVLASARVLEAPARTDAPREVMS